MQYTNRYTQSGAKSPIKHCLFIAIILSICDNKLESRIVVHGRNISRKFDFSSYITNIIDSGGVFEKQFQSYHSVFMLQNVSLIDANTPFPSVKVCVI